jgi:glycosyltransferase 2 family protein
VTAEGSPAVRRAAWKHPAVRIIGSVVILGALLTVLPFGELKRAIVGVPWRVWPLALTTYLSLHLIGIAKWRLLVNAAGAGLSFRQTARAYYWGLFGNTFLPSIVGGDVVRAGMALRDARSGTALVTGSLVDRLLDVLGLATLAGIGALLSPRALSPESRGIFLTLGGVLAGSVACRGRFVGSW